MFKVPRDGPIYIKHVLDRCFDLIANGIWTGLDSTRIGKWLSNFSGDQENYFAACILDSLVFRSQPQTITLIRHLFQRTLPDLARVTPTPSGPIDDWHERLRSGSKFADPGIRLVPVIRSADPLSKSAPYVLRQFCRRLNIDKSWAIKCEEIPDLIAQGIRIFLFIDDFLGTGQQFENFIEGENAESYLKDCYAAYAPLTAHSTGIRHLRSRFPSLQVVSVETLDDSHGVFSPGSSCFDDGINTPENAKDFYYELLKARGINTERKNRCGYGHLELAYAFDHATPDNCLPLLWWPEGASWKPLLDR